jgi:ankyrin repeat protein
MSSCFACLSSLHPLLPNAKDGKTALEYAKDSGDTEMVALLNEKTSLRADQLNGIVAISILIVCCTHK